MLGSCHVRGLGQTLTPLLEPRENHNFFEISSYFKFKAKVVRKLIMLGQIYWVPFCVWF